MIAKPFSEFSLILPFRLALAFGFGLPTVIAGYFWNDWWGGFLISGILSKVVMLHCTFCINSLAHYIGDFTYTDQRSPRDSFITALVTFGEGYHNFHHEFPYGMYCVLARGSAASFICVSFIVRR